MRAAGGRQSRRIMQRRSGETESPRSAASRYTSENFSTDEMRRARLVMILFGLVFLGTCIAYVVAAAGQILG